MKKSKDIGYLTNPRLTKALKGEINNNSMLCSISCCDCLFLEIDWVLVLLPVTGKTVDIHSHTFPGFKPVPFLPDRREIHCRHYGSPARANSPPATVFSLYSPYLNGVVLPKTLNIND